MHSIDIKYSTEAEIQSDLRQELQNAGFQVYLERKFKIPKMKKTRRQQRTREIRVDIVVYFKTAILCLVEVKTGRLPNWHTTIQAYKYNSIGVKFFLCQGADDIENIVTQIINLRNSIY